MASIDELRTFFRHLDHKVVIAADGETRSHTRSDDHIVEQTPAGGVAVAFDILCQAAGATYIGRGRTEEDRLIVDNYNRVSISGRDGSYTLKRIFLTPEEEEAYYAGFANQTLWPLCHTVFQRPIFDKQWYEGYVTVNKAFARSIQEEIEGKTFVWVNDYHLALVPSFLEKTEDTVIGLFWHIPWPTWEIFRVLPRKKEILESLLRCDFIAFHRRYQARNFLTALERELGARIDLETSTAYWNGQSVRVTSLPMGIDVDVIRGLLAPSDRKLSFLDAIRASFGLVTPEQEQPSIEDDTLSSLYSRYRVVLGVDRLDYTKGIPERLKALDEFFGHYPSYREKVVYIGIMSPTRDAVPAYQALRDEVESLARQINEKYRTSEWEPLHMVYHGFTREDALDLYRQASVCMVTPLDDGMNLVSQEFIVAASLSNEPGMLVLSQFAGSAADLTAALLVNPYDVEAMAGAIKEGLEMDPGERRSRIDLMTSLLEERDVYHWAMNFVRSALIAELSQHHDVAQIY